MLYTDALAFYHLHITVGIFNSTVGWSVLDMEHLGLVLSPVSNQLYDQFFQERAGLHDRGVLANIKN